MGKWNVRGESSTPSVRRPVGEADFMPTPARRRLLMVAKHLFARFGYDNTGLADIANHADASANELLSVDSKLELLTEILNAGWAEINAHLTDIGIESMSARRAIMAILAVFSHTVDRDEDFARLLLFDGCHPHPDTGEIVIPEGYRRFVGFCAALAGRGQDDGSFNDTLHPRVITSVLVGAAEGLMRDRLIAQQDDGFNPYSESQLLSAFDALVSYLKPVSSDVD